MPIEDDICIGTDGKIQPYSPEQVRAIVRRMLDEGEVLAVLVRVNDDLAFQVFGPPSLEILEALEAVTNGYRAALKGH